jgi:hypothetical protein
MINVYEDEQYLQSMLRLMFLGFPNSLLDFGAELLLAIDPSHYDRSPLYRLRTCLILIARANSIRMLPNPDHVSYLLWRDGRVRPRDIVDNIQ